MAARGLVPLKPDELVTLLYCLQLDMEEEVRRTATVSIETLPENVLMTSLDSNLEPSIIDILAEKFGDRPAVMVKIIHHRNTADETLKALAETGDAATVDLIAKNQVRIIKHPAIIKGIYQNPFVSQAQIDSLLEFAQRSGIDLQKLLGIKVQSLKPERKPEPQPEPKKEEKPAAPVAHPKPPVQPQAPGAPAIPSEAGKPAAVGEQPETAADPGIPAQYLGDAKELTDKDVKDFIEWMESQTEERLKSMALHGNPYFVTILAKTRSKEVAVLIMNNKRMDSDRWLKIASDRQANEELIKKMCSTRELIKQYNIKTKLATNPKTPVSSATAFVRGMRMGDLKTLARNKSASVMLQNAAKGLLKMRGIKDV
jgi:hypothetical protein